MSEQHVNIVVDTISGDHFEADLLGFEEETYMDQPAIGLCLHIAGFHSDEHIFISRESLTPYLLVSKLTIDGKSVDADASRSSDEDWIRMIRHALFLLSSGAHRRR